MAEVPLLTVVIPVLNESLHLRDLLEQLRTQATEAVEVIVVDGGSTDGTQGIVLEMSRTWPTLRLLPNPRGRSAPGRNLGARASRGKYVLFLDGHCLIPRKDYLKRHIEIFEDSGADCLCRPQPLLGLAGDGWARAIAVARHSPIGHKPRSDIYGSSAGFTTPHSAGAAYKREVFDLLGGYDERFDACEDVEFNHRVHLRELSAYRHPDLSVNYSPRSSLLALWIQMVRYGRGRARLMARHPRTIPWSLVAASLVALATAILPLLLGVHTGGLAALGILGLWLVLLAFEAIRGGGRLPRMVFRVFAALLVIHTALLLGFWRGLPEVNRYRKPFPPVSSPRSEVDHASA